MSNIEVMNGLGDEFYVLTDSAAQSLASHIRNVEKHTTGHRGFRVRDFLKADSAKTHQEWLAAASRSVKRFKNGPSSSLVRASTHLAQELFKLFDDADTWRGVLNRLAMDALMRRVRDFSDTIDPEDRTSVIREFKLVLRLAEHVYASPDAEAVVTTLFDNYELPIDIEEIDTSEYDRELDAELDAERMRFEVEKRAEEKRWQLEQQRMEFEQEKVRREEELRQFEAERDRRRKVETEKQRQKAAEEKARRQRETEERQRKAEQEHRRMLAERESIKPGTYRLVHTAAQAYAALVPSDVRINLYSDNSFVYTFKTNIMNLMNAGAEGRGRWQYDPQAKRLTLSGSVRIQMNQPGDPLFNMIAGSMAIPEQPIFFSITVQNYRSGQWEGYDNEGKHCVLTKI